MTTNPAAVVFGTPHGDFPEGGTLPSAYMDQVEAFLIALEAMSLLATARANLPADGVTDMGPALQAAYDSGDRIVSLDPKGVYLWDTEVFTDETDPEDQCLVIHGNGAKILLGPNLPTVSASGVTAFSGTRFAIFPNTLRAAEAGGVVTISDANRATGAGGALRSLIVNDVVIDGQSANRGFCYANRTAVTMIGVKFDDGRVCSTWWDYTDANTYIGCYSRGNGYSGQWFVEQVAQGDGVVILGPKADSTVGFYKGTGCRGMFVAGVVTGAFEFHDCSNVDFRGGHQEGQQNDATTLKLYNTDAAYHGSIYLNATQPAVIVDDSGGTAGSVLRLLDVQVVSLYTSGDSARAPLLSITPNHATRVHARRVRGVTATTAMAGEHFDGPQPTITGSAAIISAAGTASALAAIARGSWDLAATTSSAAFVLRDARGLTITTREPSAPTIAQITTDSGVNTGGTLTNGQVYEYAVAVMDARGKFGAVSAAVSATPSSKGGTRILLELPNSPSVVKVWRKTGTGVLTAPTVSAVLPVGARRAYLLDTGANVSGAAWAAATDIPNTVAAANTTLDGVAIGTGFLYVEAGAWKVLGGSGTVTTIGPA